MLAKVADPTSGKPEPRSRGISEFGGGVKRARVVGGSSFTPGRKEVGEMAGVLVVSCNVGGLFPAETLDRATYPGVTEEEEQRMIAWAETYLSPIREAAELPALISMHVQELGGLTPSSSPAIEIAPIPPPLLLNSHPPSSARGQAGVEASFPDR